MRVCYYCRKEIRPSEATAITTVEVGGPSDGCAEFASEAIDVTVHYNCEGPAECDQDDF